MKMIIQQFQYTQRSGIFPGTGLPFRFSVHLFGFAKKRYLSMFCFLMAFTFGLSAQESDSLRNKGYQPSQPSSNIVRLDLNFKNHGTYDSLQRKRIIGFSPQHLIKYGIRIEMERKLSHNKWLVVAPMVYFAEKGHKEYDEYSDNNSFNLLAGGGMALGLKTFARPNGEFGGYISFGPSYNYFFSQYYVHKDIDEEIDAHIHKLGFDVTLGYQFLIRQLVVMDIYTGMGARKSIMDNGGYSDDKFNNGPMDYNITMNTLLFGIKIGILY
jgi:hypothetical protein